MINILQPNSYKLSNKFSFHKSDNSRTQKKEFTNFNLFNSQFVRGNKRMAFSELLVVNNVTNRQMHYHISFVCK